MGEKIADFLNNPEAGAPIDRLIYLFILTQVNQEGWADIRYVDFKKATSAAVPTVWKSLAKLENRGFIEVQHRGSGGKQKCNSYRVC